MVDRNVWAPLEEAISSISEAGFCAAWMDEVEYRLWEAVRGGPREYGQITLADAQIEELRQLSGRLDGWVWFNDETGFEEFVAMERWQQLYEEWLVRRAARRGRMNE